MPRFFLVSVLALLSACAHPVENVQPFLGGHVSELIREYGMPAEAVTSGEDVVYTWDTLAVHRIPKHGCILVATVGQDEVVRSVVVEKQVGSC